MGSGIVGKFSIQNYQTKGCIVTHITKDGLFAYSGDFICSNSHGSNVWVHGSGNSIRHWYSESSDRHYCLDASNEGFVSVRPCTGTNHQKWDRYQAGYIKNRGNGQCLDVMSEGDPRGSSRVYTRTCLHHEWQKWAFKPL
ncbi:ricin-type beta-trefoil lectin domain protein [Streptomyces zaomyceticus]|uniref:ricin-type beta-trefoil lectin domain protein n=1 Tax=Streptomyces zaomyceticus TaxID=68286 RepID=UPI0036A1D268